jgi:hypothetical protein
LVVLAKQLDATRPVTMVFGHLSDKKVVNAKMGGEFIN